MHNTNCAIFIPANAQGGKKRLVCLNHNMKTKTIYCSSLKKKKTPEKAKLLSCDNRCVVQGWRSWHLGALAARTSGSFYSADCPLTAHKVHSSHAQETLCCTIGMYKSALFKWVYFLKKNLS